MEHSNRQLCRVPGASIKSHLGNVYLIAKDFDGKDRLSNIFNNKSGELFYVPYMPVYLNDVSEIKDESLKDAFETTGANVAVQVFMPDQDVPVFLFENSNPNTIGLAATNLIFTAEDLAKESVRKAILNYALKAPAECQKWISEETNDSLATANTIPQVFQGKVMACAMSPSFKGINSHSSGTDARIKAIMEEFVDARDNFTKYVKLMHDENAEDNGAAAAKVDKFLGILTEKQKNEIFRMYLKSLDAADVEDFYNEFIDTDGILKRSQVKISVEKSNDCQNNAGLYRIYCTYADKNKCLLKFNLKSTTIVYLMLLIARKRCNEELSTFSFEKDNLEDRALFVRLMSALYEKDEFEAVGDYNNLFTDDFGNQGRLKDSIGNCRTVLEKAVKNYESPYPFLPRKVERRGFTYYLPILPENIIFDKSFTDTFLSNPNQA